MLLLSLLHHTPITAQGYPELFYTRQWGSCRTRELIAAHLPAGAAGCQSALPGCFPPKNEPDPGAPTPWAIAGPGHRQVAFRSHLLETHLIFGVCFTCSEESMLPWTEPYLLPSDSSNELCFQLSLLNLFALLSEPARRLIRNVIPVKLYLQPTEIGFFAEEM